MRFYRLRMPIFILILVVAAIALAACSPAPAPAAAPTPQVIEVERVVEKPVEVLREVVREVPVERVVEVPQSPGELVIYSGRSESLVGPIIAQFEEVTGIDVSVKYGSTGEVAATLLEEGENTPADVFFAQDPGGLGVVANHGMFETLPNSIVNQVPDWAHSPESKWVGISGRARVVVYNTESINGEGLPPSLESFTDPSWKGRIGWPPTNGSFQAMVTAMRVLWGEEKTREWLQGIQANEPKVYSNNTSTVAATASGEVDVGFVNHYYLHRFLAEEGESFKARNYHPVDGGPGSLIMVAGAGIISTAENKGNAERFLNFMLSPVSQQFFAGQTYEYPLVDGVNTNRILTPLDEINKPDVDMAALDDLPGTQAMLRDLGILN